MSWRRSRQYRHRIHLASNINIGENDGIKQVLRLQGVCMARAARKRTLRIGDGFLYWRSWPSLHQTRRINGHLHLAPTLEIISASLKSPHHSTNILSRAASMKLEASVQAPMCALWRWRLENQLALRRGAIRLREMLKALENTAHLFSASARPSSAAYISRNQRHRLCCRRAWLLAIASAW